MRCERCGRKHGEKVYVGPRYSEMARRVRLLCARCAW